MPFEKGHEKIGGRKLGRPKGAVGRRTQLARDLVEKLNFDPLEALLKLARNRRYSVELRAGWMRDCLPFIHAKLSTTFISGKVDTTSTVTHQLLESAWKDPELAAAMQTLSLALSAPREENVIDVEPRALAEPVPTEDEPS
jgi:hypothetical protein